MVEGVINTKIKFFEVNTNGRILNRFSKDVKVLDSIVNTYLELTDVRLLYTMMNIINQYIVKSILTTVVVIVSVPWVLIIAFLSLFYLIRIRRINLHV